MESRKGQRNQTARDNRADSCSKGTGSKAYAATYQTCQLLGGVGLIMEDPWQTRVNLCLKPRYVRAAKREQTTQLDQTGDGIGGTRFQVACSSDRMVPGVEQVCDGEVMKWNSSKMDSVVRSLVAIVRTRAQKTRALKHAR
jgi:hypothetical protein